MVKKPSVFVLMMQSTATVERRLTGAAELQKEIERSRKFLQESCKQVSVSGLTQVSPDLCFVEKVVAKLLIAMK